MSLHRNSASATITSLSAISIFSSIVGEVSAVGGYAAGGRALPAATWTQGASALQFRFSYSTGGLAFTASGTTIQSIRYALIRKSSGSTTSGFPICYCSLTGTARNLTSPNILTILPHSSGVFTLA
jgi:hypothetical protein